MLEVLPVDLWGWLVPHVRAALLALPEEAVDARVARLRSAPAGRLAGGRTRRDVIRVITSGDAVWSELHERVRAAPDRPGTLDGLLDGTLALGDGIPADTDATDATDASGAPTPAEGSGARDEVRRYRERARRLQRERDDLRRRLDGAERRAANAERRAEQVTAELATTVQQLEQVHRDVAEAGAREEQRLARGRRRREAERRGRDDELAQARREAHELRAELRRVREQVASVPQPSTEPSPTTTHARAVGDRLLPGRPSTLPVDVTPGTREAVDVLLHRGRLVYVDGYNLTRTQRPDLDLAAQRRWLVQALGTLIARTGIEATVWFDAHLGSNGGRQEQSGRVRVRFTEQGLTADDELVFAVEALEPDVPVVVVTDDRELRDRLRPYAVDHLRTATFRWVLD